jgi:hypothetical protein
LHAGDRGLCIIRMRALKLMSLDWKDAGILTIAVLTLHWMSGNGRRGSPRQPAVFMFLATILSLFHLG